MSRVERWSLVDLSGPVADALGVTSMPLRGLFYLKPTRKSGHGPRGTMMHGTIGDLPLTDSTVRECVTCERSKPLSEFRSTSKVPTSHICRRCRDILDMGNWYPRLKRALCQADPEPTCVTEIWLGMLAIAERALIEGRDARAATVARVVRATRVALLAEGEIETARPASPPEPVAEDPRLVRLRVLLDRYMAAQERRGVTRKAAGTTFWTNIKTHAGQSHKAALSDITDPDAIERMIVKGQSLVFEAEG